MKLYSELARVYHEMYQSLFDYKKEFQKYNKILRKYKCKKVLEIGCGSGNLAPFFVKVGYNYLGVDLFQEMLKIAKKASPEAEFIQGDMRNLKMRKKFDAILITGKSFTYMVTNQDIMSTLQSIYGHLEKEGILTSNAFPTSDTLLRARRPHSPIFFTCSSILSEASDSNNTS